MFAEAIATARTMDEDRQRNPTKPLPPLYGLPISLKDGFKIPGFDATIGFVSLVDQPATTYSALPALLKDLGAIFYCKTSIPQTLMSADSHNNVFGRTINPFNTAMTPGGSSGGEGVLIAMRGSVLGLCTDIAGSVRIPAVCNGLHGFKACASMIPYAGQQSPASPGIPGIIPSIGPLATSSRACAFLLENVMKAEPWKYDGTVLHLPWQNFRPKLSQSLRIGLIEDNTMHTPSPPLRRALRESADKLRRAGHEIIPISLEDFNITQTVDENWEMYGLDGSQMANKLLSASGEPVVPSVIKAALLGKPAKTLPEIMSLSFKRLVARSKFSKLWTTHNVDIIMLPPSAHTAVPIDEWYSVSYTSLFNYLDWPAAVLPVGTVSSEDVLDAGAKYGERDEHVYKTYTGPEDYAGLPTSIQLVGQPQEDEKMDRSKGALLSIS
jgi:amidase